MLPKQNASSYIMVLPSSNQSYISTEQPFIQKSTVLPESKSKMIIPYNMTPLVKLFEPVKTKFIPRDAINQSIQYFNEPAEYSQAEIDLLDQSLDKSIQQHHQETYDPLQPVQMPQQPEITQYPQLFVEPPILIPYFMDYINWDLNKMKSIVKTDEDDTTRYMNFYRYFKFITTKIQHKYYNAKALVKMLIEKYQIVQRLNELSMDLKYHLDNQVGDLASQSLEQLKKHEWVQQEIDFEKLRQKLYQIRKESFEVLMLTEHVEDSVLQETSFTNQLNQLRAELDHSYDLFEEQILIYIFHDVAGVEACMNYLIDDIMNEEIEELKFFNSIPNFIKDLDNFGIELRYLVKHLRLIIKSLTDKTNQNLIDLNKAHRSLEIEVKKIIELFNEIPAMVTKMQLSINQARIILQKIRLPHNNYRSQNQEIYDEYLKLQEENTKLEQLIQKRINKAAIISQVCEEQKTILQFEITQLKEENKNVIELYHLLQGIQEKEFQLSKIQSQRSEIWQQMKQVKSEEIQQLNQSELKQLEQKCIDIIRQITSYFGQNKMPHQFIRLKLWAESELMALRIKFDVPKINHYTLDSSLKLRIEKLVKWEYSEEQNEEQNVSQYIQYFHNLNQDISVQQPDIEIELDNQFELLQDNEELLQLNETYTIWKNMQTAAIYLNDDYLQGLLSSHDQDRLVKFRKNVSHLQIFFKLMKQDQYVGYVGEVEQLADLLIQGRKLDAKSLIKSSRFIPKNYRENLLSAF
ncbi:unnamed protein product [Paramecium pentaurelia]|uniref:Uncharacterized protein n=1 Tax=Paramecium pentaurelia TaxID=43138 RepID=A0A8S1SLY8_9CILI|nr:unnamed protein product [Paramecium pentaurelia]